MKLRKQAPAKAVIVAATAVLLFGFYGIIEAKPRIKTEEAPSATPAVDYQRFFAPATAPAAVDRDPPVLPPVRTRAS